MDKKEKETKFDKQASESYEKFLKVAGLDLDEVTMVLRVHLLAEYYLDHLIISKMPRGDILLDKRFSFVQKLYIVEAFDIISKADMDTIRNLNSVRNSCSHSLDYKITEADADRIGRSLGKEYLKIKEDHSSSIKELLHWTLAEPIMALVAAVHEASL